MSAPADDRSWLIDRLAALVVEDRREAAAKERDPRKTPYYMMNISHPVLRKFYLDYISKSGETAPPGDMGRIRFELSMLHPAVLRSLAEHYKRNGRLQNDG